MKNAKSSTIKTVVNSMTIFLLKNMYQYITHTVCTQVLSLAKLHKYRNLRDVCNKM